MTMYTAVVDRLPVSGGARLDQERRVSASQNPPRKQMTEAVEKIRHQVEILRAGPTMGEPSDDRRLIAELEAEFQALKEAWSKLRSDGS